ncbi:MAG: hypothetical protein Q4A60_07095 [Pasteurellaceae bacterium]|nr:hypothetical protein [Pasteurellaceae bacterium]
MRKLLRIDQDYDIEIINVYNRQDGSSVEFLNSEVMTKGHGRLVSAASFDIINRFFQGVDYQGNKIDYSKYIHANGEIELTHSQLSELIYPSNEYKSKKDVIFHLSENPVPVEDVLYQDSRGQQFDGSRPRL